MDSGNNQITATWIGGILAALWAALLSLVGVLYNRDQKKFGILFSWKDEVTKEFPREYVRLDRCDARHAELREIFHEIRDEQKHQRGLLERHIGVNGKTK